MGSDRTVLGSKFSVSSGKKRSLNSIPRKGEEKFPISPSKTSEDLRASKYENSGKDLSGLKSVDAASKGDKNLNANWQNVSTYSGQNRTMAVKGNGISRSGHASLPSSPYTSRKRLPDLRSTLSNEGSPKSARTEGGIPTTKGHHRRIFPLGNIYKASNDLALKKSPLSKEARLNDTPPVVKGNMGLGASELNRSNKHVLGFGGCNYGHGNIVKAGKNVECVKSNEDTGNKNMTANLNCKFSKPSPCFGSVEELNKEGNMKYKRGSFTEALSFYNKAIALCPQNAACHNNKAAALAGLGKVTEAVEECLEAIKYNPCSRAHYRLGTLYTRLGRIEDARWHFKLSGNDLGPEIMQRLQNIEAHLANTKKGIKVEDWNLVLTESTLCIRAGADASNKLVAVKAEALLRLHREKEALDLLTTTRNSEESRSRKACKGTSYLLIIETQIYLYLGRFEEGVLAAEQAVTLDSNRKSLMWLRKARGVADARKAGNEFYKAGKYLEACTMYGHGLQYAPTNSVLLCNRAACRSKLGQWELAIDDCNVALKDRPDYFKALLRRAHCNARLQFWEESLQDYIVLSKELPKAHGVAKSLLKIQMKLKNAQGG